MSMILDSAIHFLVTAYGCKYATHGGWRNPELFCDNRPLGVTSQ